MSIKIKTNIIRISLFIVIGVLLVIVFMVYTNDVNSRNVKLIKLINDYYTKEDYKAARGIAEGMLIKDPDNKELISLLDMIRTAEMEKAEYITGLDSILTVLKQQESWNNASVLQRKDLQKQVEENRQLIRDAGLILERLRLEQKNINTGVTITEYVGPDITLDDSYEREEIEGEPILVPEMKDYLPEVRQMICKGVEYLEARDYSRAKNEFSNVLEIDPDNAHGGAFLAAALFEENPEDDEVLSQSLVLCRSALGRNNSLEIAHVTLARIYHMQENNRQAIEEYEEVLRINSKNENAAYAAGQIYYADGEYEQARYYFMQAVSNNPEFLKAYMLLARTEIKLNKTEDAEQYLNMVINMDSRQVHAFILLGEIYQKQEDYEQAIDAYKKAAAIKESWEYYYSIALCEEALGRDDEIANNYLTVLRLNPANSQDDIALVKSIYISTANIYRKNGKYIEAIELLSKGLDEYPGETELYNLAGIIYFDTGRWRKAVEMLETAIELAPPESDSVIALAEIYLKRDDYSKAEKTIESYLLRNPENTNPEINKMLGNIKNGILP